MLGQLCYCVIEEGIDIDSLYFCTNTRYRFGQDPSFLLLLFRASSPIELVSTYSTVIPTAHTILSSRFGMYLQIRRNLVFTPGIDPV